MNILGDSGVYTLGDTSAFVNPAGQLLLNRQGKTRMDGVGIVFELYMNSCCPGVHARGNVLDLPCTPVRSVQVGLRARLVSLALHCLYYPSPRPLRPW